ncbi:recombinase [Iodidimonas nitroreducens]|uniref:Recombinase n=1 Tax=Iodidimonas nitroreducens TaxID=1236968 RepID=A0A5A7NC56_9PROT|nr:recombinase family protein [Iodidimonas nitroreducens]GAK34624.1 DNA-invertase hin [alpha proteobacterium Q-1]GER05195.1 recombinase [Iodidimonas nitroreducens]
MPRKIGYARVSTVEQCLDLQINALRGAGCDVIHRDNGVSGAQTCRPAFTHALNAVGPGTTLVVWRLDRMSRSLRHLIEISETLTARGAFLESLTEKIDTSTAIGQFVFHILGAVAQLEREIIRERTKAGLAAAAERGCYPGRPRKLNVSQIRSIAEERLHGASWSMLADHYNVHEETLRRSISEAGLV